MLTSSTTKESIARSNDIVARHMSRLENLFPSDQPSTIPETYSGFSTDLAAVGLRGTNAIPMYTSPTDVDVAVADNANTEG